MSSVIPPTPTETFAQNNVGPKVVSSLSFPKPVTAGVWPTNTSQPTSPVKATSVGMVSKPIAPLPTSTTVTSASTVTFTAPLPPPTTTTALSFSAESLFSTKPKGKIQFS